MFNITKIHPSFRNLAYIFIVGFVVMLPVYTLGIPDGYDLGQHIRFAERYYSAIGQGDWFPGWSGDDNFGFGSAGIRFYPPLAYYVLALTKFALGSWYTAIYVNVTGWLLLGCFGVYYWLRDFVSPNASLFGAVLYALVPYHLFQFYQTVLFAEFAAAGILPFCFLLARRVVSRGRKIDVVLFGVSYAFLLMTHIPTSVITSIALALYVLLNLDRKTLIPASLRFACAFVLSVAAAAFYLARLITEVDWVQHNTAQFYSNGYYSYTQYLFPMFLVSPEQYEGKMLWHFDIQIALTAILFILPIALFIRNLKIDRSAGAFRSFMFQTIVIGIFCLFMMSAISLPIWEHVSLLQKIQFPWRWLSLFSLFAVASAAAAHAQLQGSLPALRKLAAYAVVLIVVVFSLFDLTQSVLQSGPLPPAKFEEKLDKVHNEQGCPCWWPVWAKPAALDIRERVSGDGRAASVAKWDDEEREFTLGPASTATTVRLGMFYYPHWKAKVNGEPAAIEKDEQGTALLTVPPEASTVRVYFEEPRALQIAQLISVSTWLGLLAAFLLFVRRLSRDIKLALID